MAYRVIEAFHVIEAFREIGAFREIEAFHGIEAFHAQVMQKHPSKVEEFHELLESLVQLEHLD